MEGNATVNDSSGIVPPSSILAQKIELYGFLIVMPFGIILNTTTFVVFYVMKSHRTSAGLHLMATAVVDNCLLVGFYFTGPSQRSDHINIPNVAGMNLILCKLFYFLFGFSMFLTAILLVSVTIERYISVACPLKVKSWNLLRKSQILVMIYFVISLVSSVAYVNVIEIVHYKGFSFCTYDKKIKNILGTAISSSVINVLSSVLILVFTILIAVSLFKLRRNRNNLNHNTNSQRNKE